MEINLIDFYKKIPNAGTLVPSELIPYFAYFVEQQYEIITPKNIEDCFDILSITKYKGVATYLTRQSDKKIGHYIKQKVGYKLNRHYKERIAKSLNENVEVPLTNNLFDVSILGASPYYLKSIAEQMCKCYDSGLYDACLVLMRKLIETLIIECFERFGIEESIKQADNYKYLSELIPAFESSNKWTLSRNIHNSLKKIKKYGDLSAHNRRFIATKSEIGDVKFEIRQAIQEIVLLIDYESWQRL